VNRKKVKNKKIRTQNTMKRENSQTFSAVLKLWIDENRLQTNLHETKIRTLWAQTMGKTISTYTSNISVRRNVLYLTILSAPLRQELSFSKDKIKTRMNSELGEEFIREVVIK
jgi:hypothetical protein